jgi:hypothetical protein
MNVKFHITIEAADDEVRRFIYTLQSAVMSLTRPLKPSVKRAKPFAATRAIIKAAGDALPPAQAWHETMRPIVEKLAASGKTGTGQLLREFERRRIPMRRGGTNWTRAAVRSLLIKLGRHGQLRQRRAAR